ncbi:MAG: PKD domain-containing protein [Bacteroidales bacterium]|nr:PKD domain-containing protein [Bacteroidales bacterium]
MKNKLIYFMLFALAFNYNGWSQLSKGQTISSYPITSNGKLEAIVLTQPTSCLSGSNGSIDLTVYGGKKPYSYSWSNGKTTEDLNGLSPATYTVSVTDNAGAQIIKTATITAPASITTSWAVEPVCIGQGNGSINLSVKGGTQNFHYLWNFGDGGLTGNATTSNEQNPQFTYTAPGEYEVTLVAQDGKNIILDTIMVKVGNIPLSAKIDFRPLKYKDSLKVNFFPDVTGGTGNYTYSWDFGGGITSTKKNATFTFPGQNTRNVVLTVNDGVTSVQTTLKTVQVKPGDHWKNKVLEAKNNVLFILPGTYSLNSVDSCYLYATFWNSMRFTGVRDINNIRPKFYMSTQSLIDWNSSCKDLTVENIEIDHGVSFSVGSTTYYTHRQIVILKNVSIHHNIDRAMIFSFEITRDSITQVGSVVNDVLIIDSYEFYSNAKWTHQMYNYRIGEARITNSKFYNPLCYYALKCEARKIYIANNIFSNGKLDGSGVLTSTDYINDPWLNGSPCSGLGPLNLLASQEGIIFNNTFYQIVTPIAGQEGSVMRQPRAAVICDDRPWYSPNPADNPTGITEYWTPEFWEKVRQSGIEDPYKLLTSRWSRPIEWKGNTFQLKTVNMNPLDYSAVMNFGTYPGLYPGYIHSSLMDPMPTPPYSCERAADIIHADNKFYGYLRDTLQVGLWGGMTDSLGVPLNNYKMLWYIDTQDPLTATIIANSSPSSLSVSFSADITGGTIGKYTYSWSNGDITEDPQNLTTGNYSVTITDKNGCISTAGPIFVNQANGIYINPNVNPDVSGLCTGSASIQVTGGSGNYSFLWSTGQTTASVTDLCVGTYYVTVTDQNGCDKIKQIDITNIISGIDEANKNKNINVYPNPNDGGIFYIALNQDNEVLSTHISIYNIAGAKVFEKEYGSQKLIRCEPNLTEGSYFVKITDTKGNVAYKKLIVLK